MNVIFNLKNIDQLKAWKKLIPEASLDRNFNSCFYLDKNPGCRLLWVHNELRLMDFGDDRFHNINLVEAYKMRYQVGVEEAKKLLLGFQGKNSRREYNAKMTKNKDKKTYFKAHERAWEYHDQIFWARYGFIRKDLEPDLRPCWYYEFYSPKFKSILRVYSTKEKPIYMWTFPSGRQKIYSPYDKDLKWMGNATNEDIYLYTRGSNTFILTSGSKDAKSLFKHTEFDVGALQAERRLCPSYFIDYLKRYKKVIISLDGDKDGLEWTDKIYEQLKEAGINVSKVYCPLIDKRKDWADHLEYFNQKKSYRDFLLNHFSNDSLSTLQGSSLH